MMIDELQLIDIHLNSNLKLLINYCSYMYIVHIQLIVNNNNNGYV